jgi:hypothetical protein
MFGIFQLIFEGFEFHILFFQAGSQQRLGGPEKRPMRANNIHFKLEIN